MSNLRRQRQACWALTMSGSETGYVSVSEGPTKVECTERVAVIRCRIRPVIDSQCYINGDASMLCFVRHDADVEPGRSVVD
jgi:hypothetical protein